MSTKSNIHILRNVLKREILGKIVLGLVVLATISFLALITSVQLVRYIGAHGTSGLHQSTAQVEDEFKKSLTGDELQVFNQWSERIETVGPKEAYSEFKSAYQSTDTNTAHTYAHIFGMLLYIKYGIRGISYCDATFAYGCYHSLVARAIEEQGIQIVPSLNKLCSDDLTKLNIGVTGCQHGIGHGVLSYYGYAFDSLTHALVICSQLPENLETEACEAGTYMEYNFRTMLLSQAAQRPFVPSDPFDPCDKLAKPFQKDCYVWNEQWVIANLSDQVISANLDSSQVSLDWDNAIPTTYAQLGKLCWALPDAGNQDYCFSGAGYFVGQFVAWNVSEAMAACNEFSSYGLAAITDCLENAKTQYLFYNIKDANEL